MKTTAIVAALVAAFNSALAEPICNPETLHYKPRMISTAERDGFTKAINDVCGNGIENPNSAQSRFGMTVFSRTCTEDTFSEDKCVANLQSIIEACVASRNAGGGSFVTNGLTVEVHLESPRNEAKDLRASEERRITKPNSSKLKPKPVPAKPVPAKPVPAKPTPAKPTPAKPKPVKTPPAGKACKLKPGKGKGTGGGKSNDSKKRPTKVVRDLISKLLRRTGSSPSTDYGSECDPEEMTDGGEWGVDTWRGMKLPTGSTMTNSALRAIAKSAFDEVQNKRKSSTGIVVAALYVPGQGVFLGTPAHGKGTAKADSFAEAKAPEYWKEVETRKVRGGSKYHAEDVAILYAIEAGAVKGNAKFPKGSKIAAWGRIYGMPTDTKMKSCSQGKIDPSCSQVMKHMDIDPAYDDKA